MIMPDIPFGSVVWWPVKEKLPDGWILYEQPTNQIITEVHRSSHSPVHGRINNEVLLIQKVDNLTWIEHLAKERHLV
jgi:hypothetical protein